MRRNFFNLQIRSILFLRTAEWVSECVCVCVWEREFVWVCVWEREREREDMKIENKTKHKTEGVKKINIFFWSSMKSK